MRPKNTDPRVRQAILSALVNGCLFAVTTAALLWARDTYFPSGLISVVLLILAAVNAASLIPLTILLRARLKEIQGGEEDEARQY